MKRLAWLLTSITTVNALFIHIFIAVIHRHNVASTTFFRQTNAINPYLILFITGYVYLCAMSDLLVNKVANSGLITLDLEQFLPKSDIKVFDLKDFLFMGLILKEKDYREALKNQAWDEYQNQYVAITCSADAIIPVWAYMLAVTYLEPIAKDVFLGTAEEMHKHLLLRNIESIDATQYEEQRLVIKGCGEIPVDAVAYAAITKMLRPVAKSIMYGEPCSTVPVYKKK
jgi:hypothetical protein